MKFVTMEDADLVIIGAGINGLANAKTYLELHPDSNVLILDAAATIGGVWAEHRLYPGLHSNNMLGTYEFSDFPMDPEAYQIQPVQHIPGETMNKYLKDYATHFNLISKIRCSSKVESVEKVANGWIVMVEGLEKTRSKIVTDKVIIATGLTSEPFIPEIQGSTKFGKPLFHGRDLKENAGLLETQGKVVIMGSGKSAWDAAYMFAEKDVQVEWIIRESGHGPAWIAPAFVTPLKKWLEKLVTTRFLAWFSPCIWGDADGYSRVRNFLHATWLGRSFVNTFWKILGSDVKSLSGYSKHPETAKLEPWVDAFWVASGLSIQNWPTDFFSHIRDGHIKVHIADINSLSPGKVNLSNGAEIDAEALILCTGWKSKPSLNFLPPGLETSLGLTSTPMDAIPESLQIAKKMVQMADTEILTRFPRLRNQPQLNPKLKPIDKTQPAPDTDFFPRVLTRFMVPPTMTNSNDHTLAFAGALMSISTTLIAQTQALWISSYLDEGLPPVRTKTTSTTFAHGMTDRLYETLLHNRFGKWRYPGGYGARFPDLVFDALPYIDLLLSDLGLERYRKRGGVREVFEAYGPGDYRGLVAEWRGLRVERKRELERVEAEAREEREGKGKKIA